MAKTLYAKCEERSVYALLVTCPQVSFITAKETGENSWREKSCPNCRLPFPLVSTTVRIRRVETERHSCSRAGDRTHTKPGHQFVLESSEFDIPGAALSQYSQGRCGNHYSVGVPSAWVKLQCPTDGQRRNK
ncbi:hypothetical protein Bbelb_165920 [Branchiostoma belcheri]|nr:hypothetical protein Bbelb_165920 [Branchiostoma belcheri]